MATMNLKNAQGADSGTLEIVDGVFNIEPNVNAVRQALIAFQANQRTGTHATKTRAFVRGGGKKPWRQKGTGRARQGSIRAPQWRGGAIIFGPQPRDYRQKVNRKVKRLALMSALSDLVRQDKFIVVSDFGITAPKTKDFTAFLDRVGAGGGAKVLVMLAEPQDNVLLSARNLPQVNVLPVGEVNIFDLLTSDVIVTTSEGVKALEGALG